MTRPLARTHRVVETFGPTIQGEGPDAGRPCWFVRFGGCDWRCSWCDSPHAVDPARVREAERLTTKEVIAELMRHGAFQPGRRPLIILSGGNPALQHLGPLVIGLHQLGGRVSVETQGSVWRPWLGDVDRLVISPKPPSSGMATDKHIAKFEAFMANVRSLEARNPSPGRSILKIVCFDETDLDWARAIAAGYSRFPLYLSAGTMQGFAPDDELAIRQDVADRYRWLCEAVAADVRLERATVLPQLHVIAWGARMGV